MTKRISDMIIHLDYEDEYKDGKVEVNIIASEPEELVRCKDCKHYCPVYADTMGGRDCLLLKTITRADDFCSYGERRER